MAKHFITCKIDNLYACMCHKISRALTAGVKPPAKWVPGLSRG